jgi:hypothetical protein
MVGDHAGDTVRWIEVGFGRVVLHLEIEWDRDTQNLGKQGRTVPPEVDRSEIAPLGLGHDLPPERRVVAQDEATVDAAPDIDFDACRNLGRRPNPGGGVVRVARRPAAVAPHLGFGKKHQESIADA